MGFSYNDVKRLVTASLAALRRSVRPDAGAVRMMVRDARLISLRKTNIAALRLFTFQLLRIVYATHDAISPPSILALMFPLLILRSCSSARIKALCFRTATAAQRGSTPPERVPSHCVREPAL